MPARMGGLAAVFLRYTVAGLSHWEECVRVAASVALAEIAPLLSLKVSMHTSHFPFLSLVTYHRLLLTSHLSLLPSPLSPLSCHLTPHTSHLCTDPHRPALRVRSHGITRRQLCTKILTS